MVKATERCGGARETMVMIFLGMSSELETEECGDYLRSRGDYLKGVKRLMNELDLWNLSVLTRLIVGMT